MFGRYVTLFSVFVLIAACGESSSHIEIPFVATFAGIPVTCDSEAETKLTDLRLYVHNPRLLGADGEARPVKLDVDDWQDPDLALLDLEDGSGSCLNGTPPVNAVLRGTVRGENKRGLVFTLGVPFETNHGDPLLAEAPLGDADMHWHWRGGYKFFRAGVTTADDSFWIHLGSTGCEGTIQQITGCKSPNRIEVRLDEFVPGDVVTIDLAALVADGALQDATPGDCSSGPAESSCVAPFAAFGIEHATGEATGEQQVFASSTP